MVDKSKLAPRLAAVATDDGDVLIAEWRDGATVRVVLTGWIEGGPAYFRRLRDPAVWAKAAVVDHGLTVEWAGDENLAIDTLHLARIAEAQAPFGPAELVAWQERRGISNQEAADLVGVHVNTWANWRKPDATPPRSLAMALRSMDRDPVVFTAFYRPRRPGRPPAAA